MPSELPTAIRNTEAPAVEEAVSAALFPDERDASAQTGHLGRLRVTFDFPMAEVEPQLLLLLRGQVLVAEDCALAMSYRVR
jgi:hypothetical protein